MANRRFWATAFPGHPYGRPSDGTPESLAAVTVDDLKSYVGNVFARDRLTIGIVGDIDAEAAGKLLDRAFGALPAKAKLAPVPDMTIQSLGERTVINLDVPQTVIRLGSPGIARSDPDFIAAYVVNHIFGAGSHTSRLYREVREARGLAYGVNSYLMTMRHAALFMANTQTQANSTREALELIEAQVQRMVKDGPTEDELAKAKAYLKGSYALNFDTSTKIASILLQNQLDELGIDYIDKRNGLMDAVTIEDARRAAKRLDQGGLLVTVVGQPKDLTSKEPGG